MRGSSCPGTAARAGPWHCRAQPASATLGQPCEQRTGQRDGSTAPRHRCPRAGPRPGRALAAGHGAHAEPKGDFWPRSREPAHNGGGFHSLALDPTRVEQEQRQQGARAEQGDPVRLHAAGTAPPGRDGSIPRRGHEAPNAGPTARSTHGDRAVPRVQPHSTALLVQRGRRASPPPARGTGGWLRASPGARTRAGPCGTRGPAGALAEAGGVRGAAAGGKCEADAAIALLQEPGLAVPSYRPRNPVSQQSPFRKSFISL